eukprot:GFUD01054077.1.p1 GENE.GFUD01054077.1~~GFUD01054077.1.p1  ORF type:complete len:349 (+),score=95.06 GFUD01054077.1:61-1107(+)
MDCNSLIDCYKSVDGNVDLKEFKRLKKNKLVYIRRHPSLPLSIIAYTPKAKFEKKWPKELLIARGLVVDDGGEILARPLPKFFNDFEICGSLPSGPIEVYEKMDGSLIVMFFVNGEPIFCTKGNFTSEQAAKAQEIFKSKYKELKLDQEYTYCFEVIYPENKIIVNYESEEDIFLIAKINTKTGKEEGIHGLGLRTVKQFATVDGIDKLKALKNLDRENEEGFVVKFKNNFRVKLKFETYFKKHRSAIVYSEQQIWNFLQKGEEIPKKEISEEEHEIIRTMKIDFITKFESLKAEYENIKQNTKDGSETNTKIKTSSHPRAIFCFDKGKNCDPIIWKILKPSTVTPLG